MGIATYVKTESGISLGWTVEISGIRLNNVCNGQTDSNREKTLLN